MTAPVLTMPVKVLRSATAGRRPGDGNFRALTDGEIFINTQDRVLCYLNASGTLLTLPFDPAFFAALAPLASPTFTGALGLAGPSNGNAAVTINKAVTGVHALVMGQMGGKNRWALSYGNDVAEGGNNAGSDFALYRYDDTGAYIDGPFSISRGTGSATFAKTLNVGSVISAGGAITSGSGMYVNDRTVGAHISALYRSGDLTRLWDNGYGDVLVYDATGAVTVYNKLTIGTPLATGSGGTGVADGSTLVPAGTVIHSAALAPPPGYLKCNGAAISRTAYAALFAALTLSVSGTTNKTTTISGLASTAGIVVGYPISGPGIPAGATVASIASGTSITISAAATASASGVALVVAPWGVGDGATTFTVPDFRGQFLRPWADNASLDGGRVLGSVQGQNIPNHYHRMPMGFDGGNYYAWQGGGNMPVFGSETVGGTNATNIHSLSTEGSATVRLAWTEAYANGQSGENRPGNTAVPLYIKY